MTTLREYFDTDFTRVLHVFETWHIQAEQQRIDAIVRLHMDFESCAKFLSIYVPSCDDAKTAIRSIVVRWRDLLAIDHDAQIVGGWTYAVERTSSDELTFVGRIYVYTETAVSGVTASEICAEFSQAGIKLVIRGPEFAIAKDETSKPVAFISHDSRDKDLIARPIAIGLSSLACPVWFDEFSLNVGSRLRESIEKGIRECKKCVLVLSPHFLSNSGWTKVEFNSVFTRELIEQQDFLLPIWHDVTRKDVFDYCPTLADRVGIKWSLGLKEVVRQLYRAVG